MWWPNQTYPPHPLLHHHSLHPSFLPNSLHPPTNMALIRTGKKQKGTTIPPERPLHPPVCNKAVCTTPVIKLLPKSTEGTRPATGSRSDWSRRRTRRGAPQPRSIIDVCAQLQASRHQQSVAQARLKDSWILNRRCIKIKDHSFPPPPPPLPPHYISLSLSWILILLSVHCVCLKCAKLV